MFYICLKDDANDIATNFIVKVVRKPKSARRDRVHFGESLESNSNGGEEPTWDETDESMQRQPDMCIAMCRNVTSDSLKTSIQCWKKDLFGATPATPEQSTVMGSTYLALIECSLLAKVEDIVSPSSSAQQSVAEHHRHSPDALAPPALATSTEHVIVAIEDSLPWWAYLIIAMVIGSGMGIMAFVLIYRRRAPSKISVEPARKTVYISYCRRKRLHKPLMDKIAQNLEILDYEVRYDSSTFRSDISMENALSREIDRADLVIVCYNDDYNTSETSCFESQLIQRKFKPMVPVNIEPGFEPIAWLRQMVADRKQIKMNEDNFESAMARLAIECRMALRPKHFSCCC